MGIWSVAILDSGVVDEFEAAHGSNLFEYDFYYGNGETDGFRSSSHGSQVALTVEQTNSALERIDMQISSNSEYFYSYLAAERALDKLIDLSNQGWKVGAINMSWGGFTYPSYYVDEMNELANRGIFSVAASGNLGSESIFESPSYPAIFANVISVGSHDGAGNPSGFSRNSPGLVHVLADGEQVPDGDSTGTSFSAPQVAAGVTAYQALADTVLERRLSFGEVVDILQQGGAAPLSNPDPADGATRYYLFDYGGTLDYAMQRYIDPAFSPYEYLASHDDLAAVFGGDAGAARSHLIFSGVYEGRGLSFDGLEYIAANPDLIGALGSDRAAGAVHYLNSGKAEGRATEFDAGAYLNANSDLNAALGGDQTAALLHYISSGFQEGRATGFSVSPSAEPADPDDLVPDLAALATQGDPPLL